MTKAEQKTAAGGHDAVRVEEQKAHVRGGLRFLTFVAYAAAGWGLLALLWFGLID